MPTRRALLCWLSSILAPHYSHYAIPHITSPSRTFSTSFHPDNQSTGILLRALESPGNDEYLSFQELSRSLAKSDLVPEAEKT
jgi:hypothetical protein